MKRPHINADDGITMLAAAGTCRKAAEADLMTPKVRLLPPAFGEEPERRERPVAGPGNLKPYYISVCATRRKIAPPSQSRYEHLQGCVGW